EIDVRGEPTDVEEARRLAERDSVQFCWWILGRAGARPSGGRAGAYSGIAGELFFDGAAEDGVPKRVVISVESEPLRLTHVRALQDALPGQQAELGVLLSLHEPTREVLDEAAKAGVCRSTGGSHPLIQIVTARDLLDGRRIDFPGTNVTSLRKARPVPARPDPV